MALARLTQQQKRIERQLVRLQTSRRAAETKRAALQKNTVALRDEAEQTALQEVALVPLTQQLATHPILPFLPVSSQAESTSSVNAALLPSLLKLRLTLNADHETRLSDRETHLETQEDALARKARALEAQRKAQEQGRLLGATQTQQAQEAAKQAALEMQQARASLAEAQKNAQALTDEIEALARQEAQQQHRLQEEARRLARQHQANAARKVSREAKALTGTGLSKGHGRAPVQGSLLTRWGQMTESGPSTGMTWRTSAPTAVVSPCAGHLLYSGAFRSFGNMVILDCGRNTRFVLSGFGAITAHVGQPLSSGATLGTMPSGAGALFVQLRQGRHVVNPAPYLR